MLLFIYQFVLNCRILLHGKSISVRVELVDLLQEFAKIELAVHSGATETIVQGSMEVGIGLKHDFRIPFENVHKMELQAMTQLQT